VTGDLADGGTRAEYDRFDELIAPLPMPVHVLPGNHDDLDWLAAELAPGGFTTVPEPPAFLVHTAGIAHVQPVRQGTPRRPRRLGPLEARAALVGQARQRRQRLAFAAGLTGEREPLQPRDLLLAEPAGGIVRGQGGDQLRDAGLQLEREVRRRRAHELADVVDRHLAVESLGLLGLCHVSVA
jgi:calcineurin-like phosphoesterase family protein